MKKLLKSLVILIISLIPYSCTEEDATPGYSITPEGTIIEITDSSHPLFGTKIEIPRGAVNSNINLNLSQNINPPSTDAELKIISESVNINAPNGHLNLSKPAKITLPINENPDGHIIVASYFNEVGGYWEHTYPIEVDTVNLLVTFETDHFSLFNIQKVKEDVIGILVEIFRGILDDSFWYDAHEALENDDLSCVEVKALIEGLENQRKDALEQFDQIKEEYENCKSESEACKLIFSDDPIERILILSKKIGEELISHALIHGWLSTIPKLGPIIVKFSPAITLWGINAFLSPCSYCLWSNSLIGNDAWNYSIQINIADDLIEKLKQKACKQEESTLIAYYPFNNNANDESGNGHDGIVYGATPTTDRFGNPNSAYSFDGIDNYINIKHDPNFNIKEDFSISAWAISDNTVNKNNYVISKGVNELYNHEYTLYFSNVTNYPRFNLKEDDNFVGPNISTPNNKWVHLVGIKKGTNFYLYVNGSKYEKSNLALPDDSEEDVNIGKMFNSFFTGKIDDIRIYNYAIDETTVNELYTENGWTGNRNYFKTEIIDFNDGTIPSDWEFVASNSADISNGRINAYIIDGGGTMKKKAIVSPQTKKIILEMDGYMAYSYWGLYSNFFIVSGDKHLKFRAGIEDYDNPPDVLEVALLYSDGISPYAVVYDNDGAYKNGAYHLTLEITSSGYTFKGNDPDGIEAFNFYQSSESLIQLEDISEIWYHCEAHTDNNGWIDNVSITIVE